MTREDANLNPALRRLGAAYYATLQGAGAASDVERAVDAVADAKDREATVPEPSRPSAAVTVTASHLAGAVGAGGFATS
jgi:hypothetical protein